MIKHVRSILSAISMSLLISAPLFSQEILVKDINTEPAGFRASYDYTPLFCNCGDYLFFAVPGQELWRTDGTPEGTISLGDLTMGRTQGLFAGTLACDNNKTLYFQASDGQHGQELWTSDGTKSGTKMVVDVGPNNENLYTFQAFGLIGNTYYFLNDHDNDKVLELWKTNGTESTTVMVPGFPAFTNVYHVGKSDTHHFFSSVNSVTQETELWATDGTAANTIKVLEGYTMHTREGVGSNFMFAALNPADNTNSLWLSNGTDIGTYKVKDFGYQHLQQFHRFDDKLIFGVNSNIWISDGTEDGTVPLTTGLPEAWVTIGNHFYALGHDYSTGFYRMMKTDGIAVETFNMAASSLGIVNMYSEIPHVGDNLFLSYVEDGIGQEPGTFSINAGTFHLVKDINPGVGSAMPKCWGRLNDKVYFLADDGIHGSEIWSTDGSLAGTSMLKHIVTENGSAFRMYPSEIELMSFSDKLQLLVEPVANKSAIYTSNGTADGTISKFEFPFSNSTLFGQVNDELIYFSDRKFYNFNIDTEDVTLLKDIANDVSGLGYHYTTYSNVGGKLVFRFETFYGNFSYGAEYWVTDGTEAGTHILKDINPGLFDGVSRESVLLGSKLIFQGTEPGAGSELWITDATEAGTLLLKDINPGATGSMPSGFASLGDKVIFGATESAHGAEVWITDGTLEGTKLLTDIVPGPTGSEARHFKAGMNYVFFSAYDGVNGWALWRTDGTPEGTLRIIDAIPGIDKGEFTNNLSSVSDKFYFGANDGVHGHELWVTDGTVAGTYLIDVVPGAGGSNPSLVTDIKGVAYFKADASLWRTNGTTPGTFKVSDLEPFKFVELNNWVYFTGFHPQYGVELFKVEFTKVSQEIVMDDLAEKKLGDLPFQIPASATSGLPVSITAGDELTLVDNHATIVSPGTVTLVIRQDGDALFNAAEPLAHTFCIIPARPSITVSGSHTGEPILTSSADQGNQWFHDDIEIGDATGKTYTPGESSTYNVRVTVDGCTSEFSADEVIIITGIEGAEANVALYPNPAQDHVKIQAPGSGGKVQVDIVDVQGRPIEGFEIISNDPIEHSLQGYRPGVYLIKIASSRGTSYYKFVKE